MTMTPIFASLLNSITTESFAWWLLRATLIAALACAYLAWGRRARPATRHAVAIGALCAIAILPIASMLLPALSLPVLPRPATHMSQAPRTAPEVSFAIDAPAPRPTPAPVATSVAGRTQSAVNAAESATRGAVATLGRALFSSVREAFGSMGWRTAALLTWLIVTTCLLFWTVLGAVGASRISRRSPSPGDDVLLQECERARRVLGIRRTVDLGVSSDVAIPMVVGALRPRVVIPTSAAAWSRERLAVVLLHELAHIRRRDGLWTLVARIATSIFWFHPLVWTLASHVRRDAEGACDETVLASGVLGSDYAGHLVAIARTAVRRDPFAGSALALATRSSLETRIVAILATRVPRGTSRRMLASGACAALALFAVIATVRPTPVASAQNTTMESLTRFETRTDVSTVETEAAPAPADYLTYANEENGAQKYYPANDEDNDESGSEWYDKASDLYNRGRFSRAAEAYEKAAEIGYRRATALYNAGCSYALSDQTDKAITALRGAFDEGFDDPQQFAEDDDLNSLRADPRFQKLMNDVMNTGDAESQRRASMRDFERLAKRNNVEDGEWNSVGMDLLRSGDYEHAADAFNNEFKVSKDEDALYNVACARALAGKSSDALKLLEQSITTGSVDAEHMQNDPDLMTLHKEARFDQLVTMAEDLSLYDSGWWSGDGKWKWNGNDEKHWRKSIPHFQEMTTKYPKVGRAWFNLGYAQLLAEDSDASTPSFQKALDLGYRPATTMYNLACSNAQSGNIDAAFGWLEKSEEAGMEMWSHARWDDDLDPLHSDPRFKEMAKRWRAEAKKHGHDDYNWERDRDDDGT